MRLPDTPSLNAGPAARDRISLDSSIAIDQCGGAVTAGQLELQARTKTHIDVATHAVCVVCDH